MFVLCSTCSRHVKTVPCPFCGSSKTAAVSAQPTKRLSRAQLLAGAALTSVVVAGCSSDEPTPDPEDGGGTSSGSMQPVYGAPVSDAGPDDDGGGSSGSVGPVYGAPADGGFGSSGSSAPLYGAAPSD